MNDFERARERVAYRNDTHAGQWQLTNEQIVRCKDCVWGKAVKQVGCVRFDDRGSYGLKTHNPYGFCAWGERRED